jgi:hypothetical protein
MRNMASTTSIFMELKICERNCVETFRIEFFSYRLKSVELAGRNSSTALGKKRLSLCQLSQNSSWLDNFLRKPYAPNLIKIRPTV